MNDAKELVNLTLKKSHAKIKLLGDSITHGVGGSGFMQDGEHIINEFCRNPSGYCWAKGFKEYMAERYGAEVTNNACTGTRIEFVIEHFDTLVDPEDDLVICTIGTNNRHMYFKDGARKSPEELGERFLNNIRILYSKFKGAEKPVIFMANIPASEKNEQDGADFWRILHMDDISRIYKRAREEMGFAFISMYDLFSDYLKESGTPIDALLADGLHPNDCGYDVMLSIIKSALGV